MKKRILAVVIVIIMLIALIPAAALAHSGEYSQHKHKNRGRIFNPIAIRVTIDAGAGGKVYSPGGQSKPQHNATWTFQARPAAGYTFDHWEYSGNEVSGAFSASGADISVTFTQKGYYWFGWNYKDYKAQAVFVQDSTPQNVTLNLGTGGTFDSNSLSTIVVTGSPGDTFNVPAYTVNTGYDHVGWSSALNFNSTKTVDAKYEYLSTFAGNVQVTITGGSPAWTSGGSVAEASYTVAPGYRFNGWDRSLSGISAPCTITANPAIAQGAITLEHTSGGELYGEGRVEKTYDDGTMVRLGRYVYNSNTCRIDPDHGWAIRGWKVGNTDVILPWDVTVEVNGNQTYTAVFYDAERLRTRAGANGSLGNPLDTWEHARGDKINLSISNPTPDYGYVFDKWIETDYFDNYQRDVALIGGDPEITMGDSNYFMALFKVAEYTVTFKDSQGETLGTETVLHGGNITKTKDSFTYELGERPVGDGFDASEGQNITGDKTITVVTEYQVTIDIGSGALDSGSLNQWVAYNGDAAEPGVTPSGGYHWDNPMWDASFTGITAATTITAQYAINTYQVTFVDQNGDAFGTAQTIDHGSDAAKPALDDAVNTQFDASVTAWESELLNITAAKEITVALDYLVTFDPDTGTSSDPNVSQFVAWGDDATEPVVTPPTGYHWDTPAWNNSFTNVTAPVQTAAQYEINMYTVSFEDSQGEALGCEEVAHGSDVTKVAGDFTYDAGERPIGDGWAALEGQNITAAKTIVVNTEYEVTFDENGATVDSGDMVQWIAYGSDAAEPDVTPPIGYHWDDPMWDTVFTNVTATLTTIAQFEINTYQVTFIDQNGDAYSTAQTIDHGSDAVKPVLDDAINTQFDAAITAWESEMLIVTEDREITVALEYLVTFDVTPGSSSDTNVSQFVVWGADATAPAVSPPTGHHLDDPAWDTSFTSIIAPVSTKAIYRINVYTVSFYDFDDTLLGTVRMAYGRGAEPPVIPEREGHTFRGWSESIDPITGTLSVTAVYDIKTYTVEFVDFDGTAIGASQTVDWNNAASAPANPERDGHDFLEWDKAFDHVKANLTVTAVYTEVIAEQPVPRAEQTTQPAAEEPDSETLGDEVLPQAQWWGAGGAFPWWWILVILGGIAGLFLMWWFLIFKRRKQEEEEA